MTNKALCSVCGATALIGKDRSWYCPEHDPYGSSVKEEAREAAIQRMAQAIRNLEIERMVVPTLDLTNTEDSLLVARAAYEAIEAPLERDSSHRG